MTNPVEPAPKSTSEADLRKFAATCAALCLIAFVAILAAIVRQLDLATLFGAFRGDGAVPAFLALADKLAPIVPSLFYLGAALAARAILDRISEGQYFSVRNISGLSELGARMVWGAGFAIFAVLAINDWTTGTYDYRIDFRPEPLVIGTIGVCLLVLGRLLLRAQKLESEMEAIV